MIIIYFNGGDASKEKIRIKTVGWRSVCVCTHSTEHTTDIAVTHTEHIYRESTEWYREHLSV